MRSFVLFCSLILVGSGVFWGVYNSFFAPSLSVIVGVSSDVSSDSLSSSNLPFKNSLLSTPVSRVLPENFSKKTARKELQRILALTVITDRDSALIKLYQKWMQLDARDGLEHINQLENKVFHNLLNIIALGVWSKDNAIAFDAWLEDESPDERYVDALLAVVLDDDTAEESAIVWVDFVADLDASEGARQKIMDRWVAKNPEGIVRWGIATARGRALFEEIFQTMTRDNVENSFISLALLEDEKQSVIISALGAIRSYLSVEVINQDVMFAIQALPQKVRSLTLVMTMPFIAKGQDPGEIGAMIESLPDNYTRTVMLESLAYNWAAHDHEGAAQFALTLPKSERQEQVVAGVVSQWHQKDLPAASEWLDSVRGDDVETDMAAHHLASNAADVPEYVGIAKAWVQRIQNPEAKKSTTKDVVANWIEHDEQGAAEFLREQGILSPEKTEWFIADQIKNKRLNELQAIAFKNRDRN